MEIGQIEAFVEAQRRGSITRAAEALGLTQPTLTARVRSLEAELGVTLLTRGRRGVALTPAGRRFLPRALAALDALERAAVEARAGREVKGGTLALGLASDVAVYLAPPALARFARRYPDVDVRVVSGRSRAIAEALRADEIEAGIVSPLPEMATRSELHRGELVALSLARQAPRRTISLLLRSGAEPSAAASALLRIMRPG